MSRPTRLHRTQQSGFTLIELLVVLAIIALLFGLSTVNLGRVQTTASVSSTANTLLSDLKSQQILAMAGNDGGTTSQQPQGIYIQPTQYTLFADSSYSGHEPDNFTVTINSNITLSTTFPDGQVVFEKGDGAVSNFTDGDNTITLTGNGTSQTITINRFGATSSSQ